MKFPLLATTLLATSPFKAAADLVEPDSTRRSCILANRRKEGISPVMASLLNKQPSPVACAMLRSLASRPRTCATPQAKPKPAKAELPPTPASNPLVKFDYRKGDDARTVQEFAKAVKSDFIVTPNKNAKNPELFNKNPIMVYGENHIEPVVPSLRTPKGALLLESDDPNRCMPKHKMDSANSCTVIDKDKAIELAILKNFQTNLEKLVNLLEPNQMDTIVDLALANGLNEHAMMQIAMQFVDSTYPAVLQSSSPKERKVLETTFNKVSEMLQILNKKLLDVGGERDQSMLKECERVIAKLPEDASATIVVGVLHSRYLATKLSSKFPDRAVVLAVNAEQGAQEVDAQVNHALKK